MVGLLSGFSAKKADMILEEKRKQFREDKAKAYTEELDIVLKEKAIKDGKALAHKKIQGSNPLSSFGKTIGGAMLAPQQSKDGKAQKPSLLRNIAQNSMDFMETGDFISSEEKEILERKHRKNKRSQAEKALDIFGALDSL